MQAVLELKRYNNDRRQMDIAMAIWKGDREGFPEFRWDVLSQDVSRLRAAEALALSLRYGDPDVPVDVPELRLFSLSRLESRDVGVRLAAVTTLMVMADGSTVKALVRYALDHRQDTDVYDYIVTGLSAVCGKPAADGVARLLEVLPEGMQRQRLTGRVDYIYDMFRRDRRCDVPANRPLGG
ncbi:MAG: hypothetical protein J0M16_10770 [Gammaproteobacteria bacterium]|nr:hypothetical protein [Gammaproteobacteria bacterium]